jgi:hypothetical protein
MTAVPSGSGGSPGWEIPDEGVGTENADVLALAGQPAPAGGAWLWVTAAEGRRGGNFTALFLPRQHPVACGGDVLVHVSPATEPGGETAVARAAVWAVVAGSLVCVADWDPAGPDLWPETARETVIFAMGALTELEQHGADVAARQKVDVIAAAGSVPSGFPSLPTQVSLGG